MYESAVVSIWRLSAAGAGAGSGALSGSLSLTADTELCFADTAVIRHQPPPGADIQTSLLKVQKLKKDEFFVIAVSVIKKIWESLLKVSSEWTLKNFRENVFPCKAAASHPQL